MAHGMKTEINEEMQLKRIDDLVKGNAVVIFMKGDPQFPMCGYSARAAESLRQCGVSFAHVNVLADPGIYECLPRYADWETFPQIYVSGKLVGGCDIVLQMHESGQLKPLLEQAAAQQEPGAGSQADSASS